MKWILIFSIVINILKAQDDLNNTLTFFPCIGSNKITSSFENVELRVTEYQYLVNIDFTAQYPIRTFIVKFDSEATITLCPKTAEVASKLELEKTAYIIVFFNSDVSNACFTVGIPSSGSVPYFRNILINNEEQCKNPLVGYLNQYTRHKTNNEDRLKSRVTCGRRKLDYSELAVNAQSTKPGDWPWHVAIYRVNETREYVCGGTLFTATVVITAAHCVANRQVPVAPENLSVVLGKYNLTEGDTTSQTKEIRSVIIHEDFNSPLLLDNDIALLKLKTDAVFNEYVQRACLWHKNANNSLPTDQIYGSVVGWGTDLKQILTPELRHAYIPEVSYTTCILKNVYVYVNVLRNGKKFCAGWGNGTSPCNGDSGGGYMVFVPDTKPDQTNKSSEITGAWFIKGIVSLAVPHPGTFFCDPKSYVVFTEVIKYKNWILKHAEVKRFQPKLDSTQT